MSSASTTRTNSLEMIYLFYFITNTKMVSGALSELD